MTEQPMTAQPPAPAGPPAAPRATPSFLSSSLRVFDLSLGQMLWSRRTVFMALVVGGPVLIALFVRALDVLGVQSMKVNGVALAGPSVFGLMVWVFYLRFTVPVLALFYGTSLMADEVDDKTITFLFTRPIRRGAVMGGKYLAYLGCTVMVVLPSIVLVYFLIVPRGGGSWAATFPSLVKDLAMLAIGLAVYGALFAWVGSQFKRPIVVGLVFVFGWEPAVLVFPGYLKKFTVAYYLQSLVPHAMPQDSALSLLQQVFRELPSLPVALAAMLVIGAGFLALAMNAVDRREYVLEQ